MSLSHCHGLMFRSHRKPIEQEIAELQRKFRVLDAWLNETLVEAARSQHSQASTLRVLTLIVFYTYLTPPKQMLPPGLLEVLKLVKHVFQHHITQLLRRTTSELAVKILKAPSVNTRGFHRRSVRGEFSSFSGHRGRNSKTFNKGNLFPFSWVKDYNIKHNSYILVYSLQVLN